jgi:ABC-type antimicrobial peptide transport system permease subunit
MYLKYPSRSLVRGGQRTVLALICVAVGVMAIVGLQLVGGMIKDALVGNARAINGGDLSVRVVNPLAQGDLAYFDDLRAKGILTNYTATYEGGVQLPKPGGGRANVQFLAVDPTQYPYAGLPDLSSTVGGDFQAVLRTPGNAVVSTDLVTALNLSLGQTLRLTVGQDSRQVEVRVAGVIEPKATLGQGEALYASLDTFRAANAAAPIAYTTVYATTPDAARADEAKKGVEERFTGARAETADGLLQQLQDNIEQVNRFLIIVGLLALLIGGVGIVNTMQVLLARRRVEIAMLKTTGYQRRDLFLLFGLEAALLGLLGGILGALAGIGVSAAIRVLFERAFRLILTFRVEPTIVLGGVAVGLATALIFGLLPIVQAASVRPTVVLRELPEGRNWRTVLGQIGLIALLSVLFAGLASLIIGSLQWGVVAVYGTFVLLGLLSLGFGLLVYLIGRLPVPERYSVRYLLLVTFGVAVAAGLTLVPDLRGVGFLLLVATLAGYVVVLLPREWKISTKMAFRNLGRARGRTTTTLLALFIGVFAVGVVLVLGQGVRETINSFISNQIRYNVIALAPRAEADAVNRSLDGLGGDIKARQTVEVAPLTSPLDVNGRPLAQVIGPEDPQRQGPPNTVFIRYLSGFQGYNLAGGQLPQVGTAPEGLTDLEEFRDPATEAALTAAELRARYAGRSLNASDAGTDNVILDGALRGAPTKLKVGDKVTQANQLTGERRTLTVVGFYSATGDGVSINLNLSPVLGSLETVRALGGQAIQSVWYLQVENSRTGAVTDQLTAAVPRAQVVNFTDLVAQIGQVLDNLLLMLTAIASLSLFAGIVIIANAVALAMLERRRELGIMKSVGYTSGRVLGVVLIENGLIGGLGGLLGMLLVAVATFAFNRFAGLTIGVSVTTTLGLIGLVAIVAMLVAALVAWGTTRVRPLEVLRYE